MNYLVALLLLGVVVVARIEYHEPSRSLAPYHQIAPDGTDAYTGLNRNGGK